MSAFEVALPVYTARESALLLSRYVVVRGDAVRAPLCVVVEADHSASVHYHGRAPQHFPSLPDCLAHTRGVRTDGTVTLADEIDGECFVPVWTLLATYVCGGQLHSVQRVHAGQIHLPRVCADIATLLFAMAAQRAKAAAQMLTAFTLAVQWVDASWLTYHADEDGGLQLRHHQHTQPEREFLHVDALACGVRGEDREERVG